MEYWSLQLLSREEKFIRELPRVTSGSLEWSIFKSVPGSGSLSVTRTLPNDVDWLNDRVRIAHHRDGVTRPHGIWLLANPGWKWSNDIARTTISLFDKCELLNTEIGNWYTVNAGVNVTDHIQSIIKNRAPGSFIEVVSSDLVTNSAQTWDPSDTWLDVIQLLSKSITYSSLWVDLNGVFRVEPYIEPGSRPIKDIYGPFSDDLKLTGEWEDDVPLYDVPTGVVAYTQGDQDTKGMITQVNLPPSHPLSAKSRGREILKSYSVQAPNFNELTKNASRLLDIAVSVTRKASVEHPIDDTNINDAVLHRPLNMVGTIVQRKINLGKGAVVSDTIRRIYRGGLVPWV